MTFSQGGIFSGSRRFAGVDSGIDRGLKKQGGRLLKIVLPLSLVILIPLAAVPVFQGGFMQKRFNAVDRDSVLRMAHWQGALAMKDDSISTFFWGMGIGSFPAIIYGVITRMTLRELMPLPNKRVTAICN